MPFRVHIGCGLFACVAAVVVLPGGETALAGGWDFEPRVTASQGFTDNVALTKDDRKSDFITIIRPGFSLERTGGARSRLLVDFTYDFIKYARESDRDNERQELRADGGVELFEDVFFVDGLASVSQVTINQDGVESGTGVTDQSNRTQTATTSLNPNLRHHFANTADARIDYTFGTVNVNDKAIDDTRTNTLEGVLTSGRDFALLNWSATARYSEVERIGSDENDERKLLLFDTQYVDRIVVQPIASIGYELIKDQTLIDEPDGLIWSFGGLFEPGPKTSIRFTYGRRYNDPNISLDATYRISERTRLTAFAEQVLESSQSLAQVELSQIIDPITGQPASGTGFTITNNTFRQDNFNAGFEADRDRNTYRLQFRWSKRTVDLNDEETEIRGLNGSWQRQISRRLTGNLDATYRNTETSSPLQSSNNENDLYTLNASLDYRINDKLTTRLSYIGTYRTSNGSAAEYTENAVALSLTATF